MGEYLVKKIKDVHFRNPNLQDLKLSVINKYNKIQELKYKIMVLQDELKMCEENWEEICNEFILEFEE